MPLIAVKQINQSELDAAIALASSGAAFSGNFQAYINGSGWVGPNVVYTTGGIQTISGAKTFIDAPYVPYGGNTGTAATKGYVINLTDVISGGVTGMLVSLVSDQSIQGNKTFVLPLNVAWPVNTGNAINLLYLSGVSGVLAANGGGGGSGLGTGFSGYVENNFVHRGDVSEIISGIKTFTGSPLVPNPTDPSGVVNLGYLSGVSGILAAGGGGSPNSVTTTGNEVIGGFKQFTGSPFVPNPTQPSGAVNLRYLSGVSGVIVAAGGVGTGYSGYVENNFVHRGDFNEVISGVKTFTGSPLVPVPSVDSGAANYLFVTGVSGVLYNSIVSTQGANYFITGTGTIQITTTGTNVINNINVYSGNIVYNISGDPGVIVYTTGNQIISGLKIFTGNPLVAAPTQPSGAVNLLYLSGVSGVLAAAGGGSPNSVTTTGNEIIGGFKQFTGSPFVPNPTQPSGAVSLLYLSGVSGVLAAAGGGGSPNSVTTTGNEIIGGFKQFTGSPFVPAPTQPSGAVNLLYLSGVSGVLAASAGGGGTVYNITGTGSITINNTASGNINNTFNVSGNVSNNTTLNTTGNFVNMSFFFDEYNLATGVNLQEGFVSRDFFFTGYALGVYTSGTRGTISGNLYQRTTANSKVNLSSFVLNSGAFFYGSGGFNTVISGMNRVGIDIYTLGTGFTGLSVGVFGFGY